MYYCCPVCGSKKKPRVIKYYPLVVGCSEFKCGHTGMENDFIKHGQPNDFIPVHEPYH